METSISKETSSLGASSHLQSGPGPLAKYDLTGRLSDVKPISDFSGITYPEGITPNVPAYLKANKKGYYKYHRKFLLQFMPVCKMKSAAIIHRASALRIKWVPGMPMYPYGQANASAKLLKKAAKLDGRDVKDSPVHSEPEAGIAQLDGRDVIHSETEAQLDGRDVEGSDFYSEETVTSVADILSAYPMTAGASTSMTGEDPNALPISRPATAKPKNKHKMSQIEKLKLKYKLL